MTTQPEPVGIAGLGVYRPQTMVDSHTLAQQTGIPADVLVEKFGLRHKRAPGADDHAANMAAWAAEAALSDAAVAPEDVDVVIYHGSEFKDHIVWSAATRVQHLVGATRAYAFEIYALCAATPLALRVAADTLRGDAALRTALLVSASREGDLVDYANPRARFMVPFGAGGGAVVLRKGLVRNTLLGTAVRTDGSMAEDVVMPAGGSRRPPTTETVEGRLHTLDVPDVEGMRGRLEPVSLPNFVAVAEQALARSGHTLGDIDFVAVTHMKPSFHRLLLQALGVSEAQAVYLRDDGHVQSVDQYLALHDALAQGRLRDGDLVLLLGAGVGYTWSAAVVRWGPHGG